MAECVRSPHSHPAEHFSEINLGESLLKTFSFIRKTWVLMVLLMAGGLSTAITPLELWGRTAGRDCCL